MRKRLGPVRIRLSKYSLLLIYYNILYCLMKICVLFSFLCVDPVSQRCVFWSCFTTLRVLILFHNAVCSDPVSQRCVFWSCFTTLCVLILFHNAACSDPVSQRCVLWSCFTTLCVLILFHNASSQLCFTILFSLFVHAVTMAGPLLAVLKSPACRSAHAEFLT